MNTNTDNETPDYGEPWEIRNSKTVTWVSTTNWTRDAGDIACEMGGDNPVSLQHWPARAERIVQCVNACAGMADPAAELAAMREAIQSSHKLFHRLLVNYELGQVVDDDISIILPKLQPFIK